MDTWNLFPVMSLKQSQSSKRLSGAFKKLRRLQYKDLDKIGRFDNNAKKLFYIRPGEMKKIAQKSLTA